MLGLDDDGAELAKLAFHGQDIPDDGDVHATATNITDENGEPAAWRQCIVAPSEAATQAVLVFVVG